MDKPMEPERIANENAADEKKLNNSSEENVTPSMEYTEDTNLVPREDSPVEEQKIVKSQDKQEETPEETEIVQPESVNENEPNKSSEIKLPKEDTTAETPEDKDIITDTDKLTKEEIIERLSIVVNKDITEKTKSEVDALKHAFYKQKRNEIEAAKKAFLEAGNEEQDFKPEEDPLENQLKDLLASFKEKRATITAGEEKIKEENLLAKKAIIEKLKDLIESKDDFYKVYNEFKKLQQQWKEIKAVPQAAVNDLWKEYQHYSEKFYDLLKINNEMRDYDFKKNLELKQSLCEAVERLDLEKDVISAFYQLQKFHQEWREIGPVARELREDIWTRFKKASSIINKKHQEHFEALRELEQRNLEEKTALCEEMEGIDYSKLTNFKEWDVQNKRVLELQEKWKTIGFAPKKYNIKIFERFRAACDVFFQKKSEFYKGIKESMDVNLEKKKTLCEKAEALKDSQEWKETTDKMIALQKEWKTIGPVSRKYSDMIWKRFIAACDYFFEQKNTHFSSQKTEELENLKKKKEIIENINAIDETLSPSEAIAKIREYMSEFNNVGFVPFRDKDRIYKEYRTAVDKHFDRLKIDESERRLQTFKSNLNDISSGDRTKVILFNDRDKLM
ncbi:MAG: DUF349 domain-containing protein, partial [Bacteroidales bacterium]|nr:DUF349 domain-containing protein [Bacteroidales bacterium]